MMEYFRDPKNQIYADLSFRLGRIITQYEQFVRGKKFEATLYLAVLQNIMTNSNEHVRQMTKGVRRKSIFNKDISQPIWGIDKKCWMKNTFAEKHTLQNFITRVRNSVSHPKTIDIKSEFPSTGFTTIKDDSGIINKFRFINSQDTSRNRFKQFQSEKQIEGHIKRSQNEFPEGLSYEEIPDIPGKYRLVLNDKPFARISIIDLSIKQLGLFVKSLANYLAQPVQKDWDGETIKDLIAA